MLKCEVIIMKTLLKKFAILKTISSKIDTCLHKINVNLQEDSSDFDDKEWMDYPTRPTLAHVILDLLLSPTYRLHKTVTAVRIYRDESIFAVCPRCDVCIEREYQGAHTPALGHSFRCSRIFSLYPGARRKSVM